MTPPSVKRAFEKLLEENQKFQKRVEELANRLAEIEEWRKQNSGNLSKPPSSDGEKGKKKKTQKPGGRKAGGQKGHKGSKRQLYKPEECQEIQEIKPSCYRHCGENLEGEEALLHKDGGCQQLPFSSLHKI